MSKSRLELFRALRSGLRPPTRWRRYALTQNTLFICGLAVIIAATAITTQVISQTASDREDTWAKYSVPSKHHDVLDRIAGKWDHQVTVWETPGADPEHLALTADYRWLFGGRFLVGEYDGYVMGELFQAKELLGYDNYRQQYNSIWIDNMTTAFTHGTGHYDARQKALILEGVQDDVERGVRDEKFRFIYRFLDADNMTIELWRPDQGGKMFQAAKIAATRID